MNTNIYFWSCLAQFVLKCEILQLNIVEKIKTQFNVQ